MELVLKEITRENWGQCIRLRVSKEQAAYLPSAVYSLAESKFLTDRIPLAVYDGQELVGLVVCSYRDDLGRGWIHRLIIDASHEPREYSRQILQLVTQRMKDLPGCRIIGVDYRPQDTVSDAMYHDAGFRKTGQLTPDGDVVACVQVRLNGHDTRNGTVDRSARGAAKPAVER